MSRNFTLFIFLLSIFLTPSRSQDRYYTECNQVIEWSYESNKVYEDPFNAVSVYAKIIVGNQKIFFLPGFWDGVQNWSFRFSYPERGNFQFETVCTDESNTGLHGKKGWIINKPYSGNNHLYLNGPIKISDDHRHLVQNDGKPFFWLADSWWHGMTTRLTWPNDFKMLVADRKEKGFSVIQFAIGFPNDIPHFDMRGQNEAGDPWDSLYKSINPLYFQLVDRRIDWLVKQGIVPNIIGSWGYYMKWMGVTKFKKHWQYLIARYGAYPVIWTVAGEATLSWSGDQIEHQDNEIATQRQLWSVIAKFIKEGDPFKRIITIHPGPEIKDGKTLLNDMTSIDMIMLQSGHSGFYSISGAIENIKDALFQYPDKPVLHGEVCFEGMQGTNRDDVQRILFWGNMLSGTCGYSYGADGVWQFNTADHPFGVSTKGNNWSNIPWETACQYPGSRQVGIGKKILEQIEWWRLKPANDNLIIRDKSLNNAFCAEIPGELVICYLFQPPASLKDYTITALLPETTYHLVWYDPITGDRYDGNTVISTAQGYFQIPNAPLTQDWVLTLQKLQ